MRSAANAWGLMQILPATGRRYAQTLGHPAVPHGAADRARDEHPHRHGATSRISLQQFGDVGAGARGLQRRRAAASSRWLRRAARRRPRRVHRRHSVPRDAELREAHPRHGRGLPAALSRPQPGRRLVDADADSRAGRPMSRPRTSQKAARFTESVIREMTRLAQQHGAVNLSQGFPDFPAPAAIKDAACEAIRADINQYAVTWGAKPLRDAIAADCHAPLRRAGRSATRRSPSAAARPRR